MPFILNNHRETTPLQQRMAAYTREEDDVQEIEAWMVCADSSTPAVTKLLFLNDEDGETQKVKRLHAIPDVRPFCLSTAFDDTCRHQSV